MNLRRFPLPSRTLRFIRVIPTSFALGLLTASFTQAAATDDTAAQRQLREDRERFQREIERQRTEAAIQAERARQSAEQQRTADELARLRAQQDRQSAERRSINDPRPLASTPHPLPSARVTNPASSNTIPGETAPSITPDFSITLLPDGNCVVYRKGLPAEIASPFQAEAMLRSLLGAKQKSPSSSP